MRIDAMLLVAALLVPLGCAYVPSQSEMADYDQCREHERQPCHDPAETDDGHQGDVGTDVDEEADGEGETP